MTSTVDHPADAVRVEVVQPRHGDVEPDARRRRVHRDHRPGQEAEHHAVGEVVGRDQACGRRSSRAGSRASGARAWRWAPSGTSSSAPPAGCRRSRPPTTVDGADAGGDEQRADHQLGAGGVLAGVLADEAREAEPGALRHGLALVLVDGLGLLRRWCRQPCVRPIVTACGRRRRRQRPRGGWGRTAPREPAAPCPCPAARTACRTAGSAACSRAARGRPCG